MLRSVDKRLGDEAVFLLSGGDEKMHLYVKVRNTIDNYSMLSISLSRVGNELNEEQIVCVVSSVILKNILDMIIRLSWPYSCHRENL